MSKLGFKFFSVTALVPTLLISQLQQNTAFTDQQLNQQVMLAVNWVQQSGEYGALTYQAFNLARTYQT